jgi:hypothetical protein
VSGFGEARYAFEQDVAACEYADEQAAYQRPLAHHHFFHLGKSLANEGAVIGGGRRLHRAK